MQEQAEAEKNHSRLGIVRNPLEGELWNVGEILITSKASAVETNGSFSLLEVTIPPYFANGPTHLHQRTTETIYLTQGILAITLGEETMVVHQGSSILIPPHQPHRIWNPAATQATFLVYFAPARVEKFFEALAEAQFPNQAFGFHELTKFWAMGMQHDYFPHNPPPTQ